MKACANEKPNNFTFEEYPRGGYILWLRENFHEVTQEPQNDEDPTTSWIYDEYTVLMPNYLTDEFITQHFDEYIDNARKKEASQLPDRVTAIEDAIQDILEILGNL